MTTVQMGHCSVELSQPLPDRPDVIVITTSDGRRAILGDGRDPFSTVEFCEQLAKSAIASGYAA